MLVHCSNPECSAQFADDRYACPSCGGKVGEPVTFPARLTRRCDRNKRYLILFTIPLLLFGGCELFTFLCSPFSGRVFDRDVWLAQYGSRAADNPRASMVQHLKWAHLRTGMTRSEVVQLLGEPDWEKQMNLFSYNVGMWSGFRMDYDSLDVHFLGDYLSHVRCVQH
ncbi:hypothetical protein Fuma_01736 [Fuerstiella marisgermanici]|uniref:Uncharacterized protein n=2 Tax=Fuerstiella marisgermanici TaxID=1891926 RepID=A0A1P8WDN0_9PLAN|nr:hypothetical protein Fuma_01736 [Fuerstiella marisgermanici]